MKKLNQFLSTTSLLKLFVISSAVFFVILYSIFFKLVPAENSIWKTSLPILVMSMAVSTVIVMMVSMSRKSAIFWEAARELENKIESIETEEDYDDCWEEFDKLRKLSQGEPHHPRLAILAGMLKATRLKFVSSGSNSHSQEDWIRFIDEFRKTEEYKKSGGINLFPTFVEWLQNNYEIPKRKI